MSSSIPKDSNKYIVLQPATPTNRSDSPFYEYPSFQSVISPGMPHYVYIDLQEEGYFSKDDENKPPKEYLQLEDCTYENENNNYYEDIEYNKVEQKSPKVICVIIILVTLLVILIAILIGILSWNFFMSKNKLSGEPQFCSETTHQLTCRQIFVRNLTANAFNAYRSYAWGAQAFKPIALEPYNNEINANIKAGIFPGLFIKKLNKFFFIYL